MGLVHEPMLKGLAVDLAARLSEIHGHICYRFTASDNPFCKRLSGNRYQVAVGGDAAINRQYIADHLLLFCSVSEKSR